MEQPGRVPRQYLVGTSLGQHILIIHDEGTIEELDVFDIAPVERGTLERGAVETLNK